MASQRLSIATFAGKAATVVTELFDSWHKAAPNIDPAAVDRFAAALRENSASLPIVYFSEWIDRWLMGDTILGPGAVAGRKSEAACFSRDAAIEWAHRCGSQFAEQAWLAARLLEAASAWRESADHAAIVVVRDVFGGSTSDDEILASLGEIPPWLSDV